MGMPRQRSLERMEANAVALRALVDARSPRIVRDAVVGSAVSGARRRYPLPSIGHRSGKLTVAGYVLGTRSGVGALIVKCDCGFPEYTVENQNFKNFKTTRCNRCAKLAASAHRYWVYSEAMPDDVHRTRLLNRLAAAIARCHSPTSKIFKHYGGRGITVYESWRNNRAEFLRYVQTLDGWDRPDLEMDRTDVNSGYQPGNIRFVSKSDNAKNKRRVEDLEARIAFLEAENERLRHRKRRSSTTVHSAD